MNRSYGINKVLDVKPLVPLFTSSMPISIIPSLQAIPLRKGTGREQKKMKKRGLWTTHALLLELY